MSGTADTRLLAVKILCNVLQQQKKLSLILPEFNQQLDNNRDRAFLQELCYGLARWYHRLEIILEILIEKPLKARDLDIKILIMLGLYQFLYMRVPDHAVISTAVDICPALRKAWAKNLVNALLRKFQRTQDKILLEAGEISDSELSHPYWLIELLKKDYPEKWMEICVANNRRAPMFLRINPAKTSRESYLQLLHDKGINATASEISSQGILLEIPVDTDLLPSFSDGYCSVQDLSAQMTPRFMDLNPDLRVLDACAAPGGKLIHLLESGINAKNLTALEPEKTRYQRTQESLKRLEFEPLLLNRDALETDTWWDGIFFDRILLDAPCSASGIIRRQPDIKLTRTPETLATITQLQNALLCKLWPLLKPGGKLLYVTCSVLHCENGQQIKMFLDHHQDAKTNNLHCEIGSATGYGWQILPGDGNADGFFYALLEKSSH